MRTVRYYLRTFMMRNNSSGYLDLAPRGQVARGGLEEEERLLRDSVVQLFDVVRVVAAYGHDLVVSVNLPLLQTALD